MSSGDPVDPHAPLPFGKENELSFKVVLQRVADGRFASAGTSCELIKR